MPRQHQLVRRPIGARRQNDLSVRAQAFVLHLRGRRLRPRDHFVGGPPMGQPQLLMLSGSVPALISRRWESRPLLDLPVGGEPAGSIRCYPGYYTNESTLPWCGIQCGYGALSEPTVRPVNLKRCRRRRVNDEPPWLVAPRHPAAYGADDVHR